MIEGSEDEVGCCFLGSLGVDIGISPWREIVGMSMSGAVVGCVIVCVAHDEVVGVRREVQFRTSPSVSF